MSEVQRICRQCGEASSLDARYCPHCGHDSEQALPAPTQSLPVLVGKAALPVLVGAASLALRIGWRLLQTRWARETARNAAQNVVNHVTPRAEQPPATPSSSSIVPVQRASTSGGKRTIRITSTWAVGDANGTWRQGAAQHTIEIEE